MLTIPSARLGVVPSSVATATSPVARYRFTDLFVGAKNFVPDLRKGLASRGNKAIEVYDYFDQSVEDVECSLTPYPGRNLKFQFVVTNNTANMVEVHAGAWLAIWRTTNPQLRLPLYRPSSMEAAYRRSRVVHAAPDDPIECAGNGAATVVDQVYMSIPDGPHYYAAARIASTEDLTVLYWDTYSSSSWVSADFDQEVVVRVDVEFLSE